MQLYSFKWPCHWRADFPSASSPSQALHPGFSQFAGRPQERQMCRGVPGMLGAGFVLVHPIPFGGSAGLFPSLGLPCEGSGDREVLSELLPLYSRCGLAHSPGRLGVHGAKCLVLTPDKRGDADRGEGNNPSN